MRLPLRVVVLCKCSSSLCLPVRSLKHAAAQRLFLLPALGTTVVFPLSLRPSLDALSRASFAGICSIVFMVCAVLFRGAQTYTQGGLARRGMEGGAVHLTQPLWTLLRTAGIVIFAFSSQAQVPNLFAELAPPPAAVGGSATWGGSAAAGREMQEVARVRKMRRLLVLQASTMMACTGLCGLGGYVHFGDRVASNVLAPFPLDDHLINTAKLAMVIVCGVSYPVIHFTARLMLHDLTAPSGSAMSDRRRVVFTTGFYAAALTLALLTDDLGELFTVFGSLCGWATLFGVPGALLLDRGGPWARPATDPAAKHGVHRWAFAAGWADILGGGAICAICLVLEFTQNVGVACDPVRLHGPRFQPHPD